MKQDTKHTGSARFSRHEVLRKRLNFLYVKKNAEVFVGRYLILQVTPAGDNKTKIGIITTKRFHKNAVERNRAKRLLRGSFRLTKGGIARPVWIVAITRKKMRNVKLDPVLREVVDLLKKANVLPKLYQYDS